MSLKAVHIVFITVSILLAIGFAAWSLSTFLRDGMSVYLLSAVLSVVVGVGLSIYGVLFLKKLKHVGYL